MKGESRKVCVFFYGTFMDPNILRKEGVIAEDVTPARLAGFELYIRPRVNLVHSRQSCAFGALARVTHDDLANIYSGLKKRFGLSYFPEAVLAETQNGMFQPALCYLASEMPEALADPAYVRELARCSRDLGFPDWYIAHIESFAVPERPS